MRVRLGWVGFLDLSMFFFVWDCVGGESCLFWELELYLYLLKCARTWGRCGEALWLAVGSWYGGNDGKDDGKDDQVEGL